MIDKKRKKKWSETWWGLLWTLAMVEANPGRGIRVFMEVDKDLENLTVVDDNHPGRKSSRPSKSGRCYNL